MLKSGGAGSTQFFWFKIGLSRLNPILFECATIAPKFSKEYFDKIQVELASEPEFYIRVRPLQGKANEEKGKRLKQTC